MSLGQALGDPHPSGFSDQQRSVPWSILKGRHGPALPHVKVQELGPRPQHHVVCMAMSKHPLWLEMCLGPRAVGWGIEKATWCSHLGQPAQRVAAC